MEENRGVLEREIHHLRTLVKDGDQQVARLTEDLNISQQKLERSQDVQNRWKERSEALVEQLQAEQNRTILAEQTVTKYMTKIQAIKVHYQQVSCYYLIDINDQVIDLILFIAGTAVQSEVAAIGFAAFDPSAAAGRDGSHRSEDDRPLQTIGRGAAQLPQPLAGDRQGSQYPQGIYYLYNYT